MKKSKILIVVLLILALVMSNMILSERIQVSAGGLPHYEDAGTPFELYDARDPQNKAYYESLCSPAALADELPKLPDGRYVPPVNKGNHPLNYRMWKQKG